MSATARVYAGRIAGTPVLVDHFAAEGGERVSEGGAHTDRPRPLAHYPESIYFLTHAHTDHLIGLNSTWARGDIYCSHVTAALLRVRFGAQMLRRVRPLDLDRAHTITYQAQTHAPPDGAHAHAEGKKRTFDELDGEGAAASAGGVPSSSSFTVQLFDSNHCPGSVMFYFCSPVWGRILHTGDMRYDPARMHSAALHAAIGRVDRLYIDTTFCCGGAVFPSKPEAIQETIRSYYRRTHATSASQRYSRRSSMERSTS
jgi:DNA cross-link repair 1B protein